MAVWGYCRVSTGRQAEQGESLDVQQRRIQGWCDMQGWKLSGVMVERGVSGSVPLSDRPEGRKLLAQAGKGDVIVASKLDRVFRSARDALETTESLQKQGIGLVLLDLGGNISNGMGKLFMTIAAAFAEFERNRIAERITETQADLKARGQYCGGLVPWEMTVGENGKLEPIPERTEAVREMTAMRAAGASLRTISAAMREKGHSISHEAVKQLLQRHSGKAKQPVE